MVVFRINRGGVVVIGAVVLIGIGEMAGNLRAGLLLGALTAISLLLHECGHMLTAGFRGVKVHEIGVCLKGTYIRRAQAQAPMDEALIALSGPMVNAMIAAASWTFPGAGHWLAIYNLALLTSNLVPLAGSDGQRVLSCSHQHLVRLSESRGRSQGPVHRTRREREAGPSRTVSQDIRTDTCPPLCGPVMQSALDSGKCPSASARSGRCFIRDVFEMCRQYLMHLGLPASS